MQAELKFARDELSDFVECANTLCDRPGLKQLAQLLEYVEDLIDYPSLTLKVLSARAWGAVAYGPGDGLSFANDGLIAAELAKVERFLVSPGVEEDAGSIALDRWTELTACFDPSTGQLEPWAACHEAEIIQELNDKFGDLPT